MKQCDCITWARQLGPVLTDHHPSCPNHTPDADAARLIRSLVEAMEMWGSWEDGIPEQFWPIYTEARARVGMPSLTPPSDPVPPPHPTPV